MFRYCPRIRAFGVVFGVLQRQFRFFDLAFDRLLRVGDAEVADQLLGDRRAALDRFARFQVGHRRRAGSRACRGRRAGRSAGPRSPPWRAPAARDLRLRHRGARFRRRRSPPAARRWPRRSTELPCFSASCSWPGRARRRRRSAPRWSPRSRRSRSARGRPRRRSPPWTRCSRAAAADADPAASCPRPRGRAGSRVSARASPRLTRGRHAALRRAFPRPAWLWTIPSTSIWFGITTRLPSPGSTRCRRA